MRSTKMLGLAALATMATMAFIGAGTASATTLCMIRGTEECPESKRISLPATIDSAATLHFTIAKDHESCESVMDLTLEKNLGAGAGLSGKVSTLSTPGNCEPAFCEGQKYINLPYHAELHEASGDNGTLTLSNGGSGNPALQFTECGHTLSERINQPKTCTYPSEGSFQFSYEPDLGVITQNQHLVAEKGAPTVCPGEMQLNATYSINEAKFEAQAKALTLSSPSHKSLVTCEANMSGSLGTSIPNFAFPTCKTECSAATALNLPYGAHYSSAGPGEGTLEITSGGKGDPTIHFTKCSFLNLECTYTAKKLIFSLSHSELVAKEQALTRGSCNFLAAFPETALWNGTFAMTSGPTFEGFLAPQP